MLTTQSKLTVQAPAFGERGARQMSRPWLTGGSARPVHCPVSGVGRLNGSLLGCLRKDVALCHTASRAWDGGEDGVLRGRHISCAPSVLNGQSLKWNLLKLLNERCTRDIGRRDGTLCASST
ncbi:hypothetical protein [Desulfosporosinus sp. Sb-LF]|uniref:hypothetical protein n=1 Tax=Desulfosporosinus sp. Sb-LF TaxID=2560027 RepID=UPI00107EF1C3|nr:hypothetical protein [Desulfosporosinus sp. Sb-LF]TGE31998.1 hypothetical protein E4K68_15095 [Desulfosporosinus sp. Sb-LF]